MQETQKKIKEITNAMQDLLLYKNEKYGNCIKNYNIKFSK